MITALVTDPDLDEVTGPRTWSWSEYGSDTAPTGATYTLVPVDAGNTLTVTATYFDGVGAGDDTADGNYIVPVPEDEGENTPPVLSGPATAGGAGTRYDPLH